MSMKGITLNNQRAGWIWIFILFLPVSVGAVTILPEGYDPSAPVIRADVGLQEEEAQTGQVIMKIPAGDGPKVTLTLRKPVESIGSLIRMGDVCAIECQDPVLLAELEGVDLAEAPPPGQTTFIYPRRIEATLRKMGMGSGDFIIQGPDRIAVETPSQEVSMEQIEEAIHAAFEARVREGGGNEEINLALLHRPSPVSLPPGELEIEITDMDRPGSGVRNVLVTYRVDGKDVDTQTIPVRVTERRQALVAARSLQEGTILTAKDVTMGSVLVQDHRNRTEPLKEVAAAVGARLKITLNEGDPINKEDIEWIPISKKGEPVQVVKRVGNVRLSLNGNLMEDLLYIGQEVKVKLRKTKKEVVGKVTSDGTIEIH